MTDLENKIQYYANCYYQGQAVITDEQYDTLLNILKEKMPDSELLKKEVIGSDMKGVAKKYKLPVTMGTLAKCNSDEEFSSWWDKHSHDVMCQTKMDGAGALLEYKNGKLIFVYSRGDSEYGEDLTNNAKLVNGVVKEIPGFTGYIRGEVLMKRSIFRKYFSSTMSNPRNATAGILKRLDGKDCDKLNFVAYDVFCDSDISESEQNKIDFLKDSGFETPMWWQGAELFDIIEFKNNINQYENAFDYNIDGIVVKQNKVSKEDLNRKTPLNNVAFKPNLQTATTTVKKIKWQLKGRYLSPVAYVDTVELEGTEVSKASISNVNIMNELGIYEGAEVILSKHGQIIPQVDYVLKPKENAFDIPTCCPVCGGSVVVNDSGIPECLNENCPKKTSHRFRRMFKVFGIKGVGDAFLNNLEKEDISVQSFLEMCRKDDEKVLNKYAGGINGEKVYTQMKNAMGQQISAAQFLATFDVKLFDEKKLNQLGEKTLDEIMLLSYNDIICIDGFAETTANALLDFLKEYEKEIYELRKYFTFKSIYKTTKELKEAKMDSVCFTGTCSKYKRSELSSLASKKFEVKDRVTKELTYLVCEDPNSGSSKIKKAEKDGINIISYDDFLKMLGV